MKRKRLPHTELQKIQLVESVEARKITTAQACYRARISVSMMRKWRIQYGSGIDLRAAPRRK